MLNQSYSDTRNSCITAAPSHCCFIAIELDCEPNADLFTNQCWLGGCSSSWDEFGMYTSTLGCCILVFAVLICSNELVARVWETHSARCTATAMALRVAARQRGACFKPSYQRQK
eukprot:6173199-Pleurochrysis_carterae.AAC.1